jgi:pyruvate/2-oxoglutarate dehydrogenase complex dihydrolipoamide acyltransferase (E2) component
VTDNIGKYNEFRLPKHRELVGIFASLAPKRPMQALAEFDVTKARAYFTEYKEKTGQNLSFSAWLIKCVAHAIDQYKDVQGFRKGKKLIVFDDVDVWLTIERKTGSEGKIRAWVVRKANEKTVLQIHQEIRAAQEAQALPDTVTKESEGGASTGPSPSMPSFIVKLGVWRYKRDPFRRKMAQGTVGMTSVGNIVGETSGFWGFPIVSGPFPLWFTIGVISRKPGLVADRIEARDYLPLSVVFDHDVVDGGDAARFLSKLGELLSEAYGLE